MTIKNSTDVEIAVRDFMTKDLEKRGYTVSVGRRKFGGHKLLLTQDQSSMCIMHIKVEVGIENQFRLNLYSRSSSREFIFGSEEGFRFRWYHFGRLPLSVRSDILYFIRKTLYS